MTPPAGLDAWDPREAGGGKARPYGEDEDGERGARSRRLVASERRAGARPAPTAR